MRIKSVHIGYGDGLLGFKNLNQFEIAFNQDEPNSVLLGQNATGKSNFIEALILIFKYLDLKKIPKDNDYFDYRIVYSCRGNAIDVEQKKRKQSFTINGQTTSKKKFFETKEYLPKYVFTYYSGLSNRLHKLFWEHQEKFYRNIIKKDFDRDNLDDLRRLFYVQPTHSFFVLMAFFALQENSDSSQEFLKKTFNIVGLESILFVLKKPSWKGKGDSRFWGADGLVKEFLNSVWDYSLAPIYNKETENIDYRHTKSVEKLFLYISDNDKLKKFVKDYFTSLNVEATNTSLFKAMESTYISELLDEVRVKVKKEVDGEVTFKELSEGEQQLLTVLGLLKFTQDDESLILLDEPDTHLNPMWKWEYLENLNTIIYDSSEKKNSSQIIINTHDPLVIGSLEKEQVVIFKRDNESGQVKALPSQIDPKGLGVAGVLTSELFGLPTILDKETQEELNKKRYLQGKIMRNDFTPEEHSEYQRLKMKLENYGFYEEVEDTWFKRYLAEMSKYEGFQKVSFTNDEQAELEEISRDVVKELLKQRNNKDVV